MALDKHFSDGRCDAEIAVDLERRMCIKQIRIDSAAGNVVRRTLREDGGQQIPDDPAGMIAVEESRPESDSPSHCPSGAQIAAAFQRDSGGVIIFSVVLRSEVRTRIDFVEVGDMAVMDFRFLKIFAVFEELAFGTDRRFPEFRQTG